ncbi:MAG: GntR family transcriptional regulator [Deltaproteobacteria bacterium]|jgi:GntR family transcriptional regulator|nr:GntR family transcriptional regulator [Deltaproteobacteria bacterium]
MVPLYFLIESFLKNKILSGLFEPGQRLPTEQEMIAQFGVSRITIRSALSHLESEGLVVKRQAKGTFVAENIPVKKQWIYTGNLSRIIADGKKYKTLPVGIMRIKIGEARAPKDIRQFFDLKNEDDISRVQRVRFLDGIPISYVENFLCPEHGDKIDLDELSEKTMPEVLQRRLGFTFGRGELFIEAMPADPDIAAFLNCSAFATIIFSQVYYWFPGNKPLQLVHSYIRGDYFKYKVDIDVTNGGSVHPPGVIEDV